MVSLGVKFFYFDSFLVFVPYCFSIKEYFASIFSLDGVVVLGEFSVVGYNKVVVSEGVRYDFFYTGGDHSIFLLDNIIFFYFSSSLSMVPNLSPLRSWDLFMWVVPL